MKNKKLQGLSKELTEKKLQNISDVELKAISGGKNTTVKELDGCGTNDCWGFSASGCDKNSCWSY